MFLFRITICDDYSKLCWNKKNVSEEPPVIKFTFCKSILSVKNRWNAKKKLLNIYSFCCSIDIQYTRFSYVTQFKLVSSMEILEFDIDNNNKMLRLIFESEKFKHASNVLNSNKMERLSKQEKYNFIDKMHSNEINPNQFEIFGCYDTHILFQNYLFAFIVLDFRI